MPRLLILAAVLAVAIAPAARADDSFVPFVIPPAVDDASLIALPSTPIDPARHVTTSSGQFVVGEGGKPLRVWGVNLCFGACFPDQPTARAVARRLAAYGVNAVRLHHMDTSSYPRGLWENDKQLKISQEALLRLDYFVDQLAQSGVYVDLNLHVGRQVSRAMGLPQIAEHYDKMINLFTPELIAKQKEYARWMLDRTNTVRKVRYADDPAIAFVEITNENSLFMWSAQRVLPTLPEPYAGTLRGLFAQFLKARYGGDEKLREAWSVGAQKLGASLLADAEFKLPAGGGDKNRWVVEQHEGAAAKAVPAGERTVRLDIAKTDSVSWHVQFRQGGVKLEKGKFYTVTFAVRATAAPGKKLAEMSVGAGLNHEPWGSAGFYASVQPTLEWKNYRFGFTATATDDDCRLSFSAGTANAASVELREVALRPGGREGLMADEMLDVGTVRVFAPAETAARTTDRYRFLAQTEKAFFDGMYAFLKKDLGVKAMVTGTSVFGPLNLYAQSGMDYIDGHAYWQHPHFPHRQWDPGDWTVQQIAMTDHPDSATLPRLACEALAGKPYTVSEYNHPMPNDYQAECVPLIASYGCAQGWSGVWLFAYSHDSESYDSGRTTSYFNIHANPAKWGFMRSGSAIFQSGSTLPPQTIPLADPADPLASLVGLWQQSESNMLSAVSEVKGLKGSDLLTSQVRVALAALAQPGTQAHKPAPGHPPMIIWQGSGKKDGAYAAFGPNFLAAAGWASQLSGQAKEGSGQDKSSPIKQVFVSIQSPQFLAVTIVGLDNPDIDQAKRVLITACGRAENTGMIFSADRRTVGRNWGQAPIRIEAVQATLDIPPKPWRCHALTPAGLAGQEVPIEKDGKGSTLLRLDPKYQTMWYLLER